MHVLLVHGYLAPKAAMWPLARRLQRRGHTCDIFGWATHRGDLEQEAERLSTRIRGHEGPRAVVAHSLGGVLAHKAVREAPVDKMVLLAVPHSGLGVARVARGTPIGRLLPDSLRLASTGRPPALRAPTGIIVGSRDRTVKPQEAAHPEARATLTVATTHNGLLVSAEVAGAVDRFLRTEAFEEGRLNIFSRI